MVRIGTYHAPGTVLGRGLTGLVYFSLWSWEVSVLLCSFSDEESEVYRDEMICPKI